MPPNFKPTRQRKHRKRDRDQDAAGAQDSNAAIVKAQAASPIARNVPNRTPNADAPKHSGKKAKRFEKYMSNKLRKDESMGYLRLLEAQKQKDDATRSTAAQEDAGIPNGFELGKRKRDEKNADKKSRKVQVLEAQQESEDEWEEDHPEFVDGENNEEDAVITPAVEMQQGSGLAQPLQLGDYGLPVIESRKKKGKRKNLVRADSSIADDTPGAENDNDEEWAGFSDDGLVDLDKIHGREDAVSKDAADKIALIKALVQDVGDYGTSGSEPSDAENDDFEDDDVANNSSEEDAHTSESDSALDTETDSETASTSNTSVEEKPRTSIFKAWATQQLNQSLGHTPSYDQLQEQTSYIAPVPKLQKVSAVPTMMDAPLQPLADNRKAYNVHIKRSEEIEATRSQLPILAREQELMESIHNNSVVIIKGDTGSGKTTQVPQLLYEAGYGDRGGPTPGMIGITQPRRVAATAMAARVAEEMGDHGHRVAHQIRFESSVKPDTAMKFMTDGILIRELQEDLLLRKYSVIVIDEAHERSVNTDLLVGILSKVVPARLKKSSLNPDPRPLKVVIMSATLNIESFLGPKLFGPTERPPVVEVEGRQHKVTTHFALRSRADYLDEVVEKVRRAHRKLPKGGMLVFLTGQNEIKQVGQQLKEYLVKEDKGVFMNGLRVQIAASEVPFELEDMEIEDPKMMNGDKDDFDEVEIVADDSDADAAEEQEFDISDDEADAEAQTNGDHAMHTSDTKRRTPKSIHPYTSAQILPLYSQLPISQQSLVFEDPPAERRLIILATNVAETSITIPNIRYVFDTGRAKERKYNLDSGVQSFEIDYISKASASQRAGRAGRTSTGHCWRLYTSAVYEQFFPEHAEPEIVKAPAESVVLSLKGFNYPKPVKEFPFPTSPSVDALEKAERLLMNLGALTDQGKITDVGKQLVVYPLSPRLGKIMISGVRTPDMVQQVIALVSGLAIQEIYIPEAVISNPHEGHSDDDVDSKKQAFGRARAAISRQDKSSDAIKLLNAVSLYNSAVDKYAFCKEYFLRPKAMSELVQLQRQLIQRVRDNNPTLSSALSAKSKAGPKEYKNLNQIVASGYIDQVAVRADLSPHPPEMPSKPRRSIDVPYLPLIPLTDRPQAPLLETAIFIHPSSVLAKQSVKDLPMYIIYTHLQRSQMKSVEDTPKTRMLPLCPIEGHVLVMLAKGTSLLEFGRPQGKIDEIRGIPRRRECVVATEIRSGTSGIGWPLPSVRVRQVLDVRTKSGWRVEELL